MASSMAVAAAHSIPPFPLPAIPRIRPPPLPKGTPAPNTLPQPGPPPRPDLVWADGRWTLPFSKSAKHKTQVVSRRLEKALQHEVRGMNIYAYRHIQTQQVVYSLTKHMDNNKILKQLLFHGKKTVPEALRRDLWRPYFSVHFPQTPAGAMKGLRVFRELRELSALRQLSPPRDLRIASQKDIDEMKRGRDSDEWDEKMEAIHPNDRPLVGKRLPPKSLARKLMDQAATSVADVAAVLTRQAELKVGDLIQTPQQRMKWIEERRKAREEVLSIRAHQKLSQVRQEEAAKASQLEQRQEYLNTQPGMVKVNRHTRDRINTEYDGVGTKLTMIEEADRQTSAEVGAAQALQHALEKIEDEKRSKRQAIEEEMSAKIEQKLMSMTQAERDQMEKDVEKERAQKQSEINAQIVAVQEEIKAQRAELYKQPATRDRRQALRKLSREGHAKVFAMKIKLRTRYLKWVGPFAPIAAEVDQAMAAIDAAWKRRLSRLRTNIKEQEELYADPKNHEVEIRWADIRDGTHAKAWPDSVFHVELQPKAVNRILGRTAITHFHLDADEEPIEAQYNLTELPARSSVHVFGSAASDVDGIDVKSKSRYQPPAELSSQRLNSRATRVQEWKNTETALVRDRIVSLRFEIQDVEQILDRSPARLANTPYISAGIEYIDLARATLNEMSKDRGQYKSADVERIEKYVKYVFDIEPYCREELENIKDRRGGELRIKHALLSGELILLESQHPEACDQAGTREEFFTIIKRLEGLGEKINTQQALSKEDSKALRELFLQHPFIANALSRDESFVRLFSKVKDSRAKLRGSGAGLSQRTGRASSTNGTNRGTEKTSDPESRKLQKNTIIAKKSLQECLRELRKHSINTLTLKKLSKDNQAWLDYRRAKDNEYTKPAKVNEEILQTIIPTQTIKTTHASVSSRPKVPQYASSIKMRKLNFRVAKGGRRRTRRLTK